MQPLEAHMITKKPPCADFILATTREIRIPSGNAAPGIATGARINQIWEIAREIYSWEEFVKAVNSLLARKTILVTAHANSKSTILMQAIPAGLPPPDSWRWPINKEGAYSAESSDYLSSVKLYIVEDGLPEVVKKIVAPPAKKKPAATAQLILDSMRLPK